MSAQKSPSKQQPPQAVFTPLLNNLFSSITSNKGSLLQETRLNFYNRILFSRFNLFNSNETQIVNTLFDKAEKATSSLSSSGTKSKSQIESIERLQTLYARLSKKKIPTKRWAVLYLLSSLSQSPLIPSTTFITANINPPESIAEDINSLKAVSNESDNMLSTNHIQKKDTLSPIVVNVSKTSKIITEKDLINDLMFVFQGIDGHYITYNSKADAFCLNNIIPFNENIVDIVSSLCELGWLYKKVSNYLTFFNESNIPSQFIQSFSYAVQSELNEYYKLISFFKKKNESSNESDSTTEDLSLKNLVLWTTEPIERMRWLAVSCESVYTLRGTAIISQIYSYVNTAGAEIYLNKVLEEISKPFITFIRNWILYGDLQDPYKEFFVDIIEKINEDDIWNLRYKIVYKNIPNFLSRELAIKIFEIGKCINFIRTYCEDSSYSLSAIKNIIKEQIDIHSNDNDSSKMDIVNEAEATNQKIQNTFIDIPAYSNCLCFLNSLDESSSQSSSMTFLTSLISQVHLIHSLINKEVIKIFYDKFHFKENLTAINRYLLLGQGDMMQSLMESLFDELKKPASHIYKHNLQANLETAIRASNAKFNDKECLKKLNIKLMDASTGDTGWDIFLLEYNVDVPLTVIFTKSSLKEYQKLFFFFWKLKRLEYSQDHQIWRKFMTYAHTLKEKFDVMRTVIQRSMLFNQQVIHFVSNLHNFIALEVLETQYKIFFDKLPSITSLDELISLHRKFVDNVINQSLLNTDNNSIYKKIIQIFDLIIRFRTALDVLTTTFLEDHYENMNVMSEFSESIAMKNQFSSEAANQILNLFEEFKLQVTDLINSIEYFGKGNMKYLAMKLDYNYYYSILEKETENRKQMEVIEKMNKEEEAKNNEVNEEEEEEEEDFKEDPSGVDYEHYNITNNDEEIDTGKKTYEINNHSQDVNDVNMDNDDNMNIHFNNSSHHSDNNNISSDS